MLVLLEDWFPPPLLRDVFVCDGREGPEAAPLSASLGLLEVSELFVLEAFASAENAPHLRISLKTALMTSKEKGPRMGGMPSVVDCSTSSGELSSSLPVSSETSSKKISKSASSDAREALDSGQNHKAK